MLKKIVVFWMGVNINGFYPFWYCVALSLLGLLAGVFGEAVSGFSPSNWLFRSGGNEVKGKVRFNNSVRGKYKK